MRIVILNGPNLNLLGRREPAIYGTRSMEQVLLDIQRAYPDVYLEYRQSNHEGDLIDWVQEFGSKAISETDGIVLNAGGPILWLAVQYISLFALRSALVSSFHISSSEGSKAVLIADSFSIRSAGVGGILQVCKHIYSAVFTSLSE